MKKIRLLVTCRDPASASVVSVLIPQLVEIPDFDVFVLAQAPASQMLAPHIPMTEFSKETALDDQQKAMAAFCDDFKPDAILTGISGPDTGVDEAALIWAELHGVPSYALQNYWGDINQAIIALPKVAFVLDQQASKLTHKRYPGIRCIPTGSIKHAEFEGYDSLADRHALRPGLVMSDQTLVGFYGQPLEDQVGYIHTLEAMADELKVWDKNFRVMYRPHPKESVYLIDLTFDLLQQAIGDRVFFDPGFALKQSLSVCDLVVSAFSTCGFDGLYLNAMAPKVFNASVYLWFDPDLVNWWEEYNQTQENPLLEAGLVLGAHQKAEILDVFERGLDETVQSDIRHHAQRCLPKPEKGVKTILETLVTDLRG